MNIYEILSWSILLIAFVVLAFKFKEQNVIAKGVAWTLNGVFQRTFIPVLAMLMTDHTKRIIVTSSLCSHMVAPKNKELDDTIIKKLYEVNDSLHLTEHTTEAVLYPAAFHELIWGSAVDVDKIKSNSVDADSLVSFIPSWLRYSSIDVMKRDIEQVLQISNQPAFA